MKQVIVFAGTTEGRIIGEWLAAEGVETLCCVATEYGKELMKPEPGLDVRQGRLSAEEMQELFEKEGRPLVLDVTHPYASAPDPPFGVFRAAHGRCRERSCRNGGQCGGGCELAVSYGGPGICHDREQGAFKIHGSSGFSEPGLCPCPCDAGGGAPVYGAWVDGDSSDLHAGALFQRTESGDAAADKSEIYGDEGVRQGGRLS